MRNQIKVFALVILGFVLSSKTFALISPVYYLEYRPSKTIEIPGDVVISTPEQAVQYLVNELNTLSSENTGLYLLDVRQSILGTHYTFNQTYMGTDVWQASIRLHVDKEGHVFLAHSTLATIRPAQVPVMTQEANRLVTLNEGGYAWGKYEVVDDEWGVSYEQLKIGNSVVWKQEGRLHLLEKDTTVFGYVYLPNPVNSAGVKYGVPYVDSGDANTQVLRDERKLVQFKTKIINDTFVLQNDWLRFKDFSNPVTSKTYSLNDSFLFNRSEAGFEDVNAFYHITKMADYVTDLGFGGLIFNQMLIDAHGQFGQDNSSFNYLSNPVALEFGTGGVDDAEDGEVVIHEFAHSLSHGAAPFTFEGTERRAMEEGNSDYFSVTYKRQYTDYNWQSVFAWDGHNEYWDGFSAQAAKNYKKDLKGIMNEDREIWSSSLTCIYEKLRREVSDSLILSYLYLQSKNTTMPQMAKAILKVDTQLWGGKYYVDVKQCFVDYGILEWSVSVQDKDFSGDLVQILNSLDWANNRGALEIKVLSDDVSSVEFYDMTGKLIHRVEMHEQGSVYIPASYFEAGMYLLRINTPSSSVATKVMHY